MEKKRKEGIILTWDEPDAVDLCLAAKHVATLLRGKPIEKPTYSFRLGLREQTETVYPAKIIVIEGNFAFTDKLMMYGDVKISVKTKVHGRMIRRFIRDVILKRTSMSSFDALSYFQDTVQPMHEKYIESQMDKADFIIENEYNPKVEAVKAGMSQVQLKFRGLLDSEILRKAGAEWIATLKQVDYYYFPTGMDSHEVDETIRIRKENEKFVFTYKGPKRKKDKLCRRYMIPSFQVDKKTSEWFSVNYGNKIEQVRKNRTIFLIEGVIVCLDQQVERYKANGTIWGLGDFTEISCTERSEQHDCERVALVAEKLGFDPDKGIKTPYVQM